MIQVELAHSSLGIVLVAVSRDGIRAVQIGDDPTALKSEAEQRLGTTLHSPDRRTAEIARQVVEYIETPGTPLDVPLDIQGTPFQQSVWKALREIPAGSTISYSELAERIGRPAAVRAVAHACAENAHAVLIPCHRVVRNDGSLAGYRWGIDRKRAILEREAMQLACGTA
jgi:AraC family transcriptional regulator of adaptative response/methylated-DNA-[protein]-cysteine methyltransferase